MVIDWMENGLVVEYVRNNPNVNRIRLVSRHLFTFEETSPLIVTAIFQVTGVARGLEYLHSLGVVHGDVTPVGTSFYLAKDGTVLTTVKQNILVNAKGDACLTDFGLSIVTHDGTSPWGMERRARGHSPICVAPETLREGKLSNEADMYCFSLAAIEVRSSGIGPYPAEGSVQIFKGESPWGARIAAHQIATKITLNKRPSRPEGLEPCGLTAGVWDCLVKCLDPDPANRMTVTEVLEVLNSAWVPPLTQNQNSRKRLQYIEP